MITFNNRSIQNGDNNNSQHKEVATVTKSLWKNDKLYHE